MVFSSEYHLLYRVIIVVEVLSLPQLSVCLFYRNHRCYSKSRFCYRSLYYPDERRIKKLLYAGNPYWFVRQYAAGLIFSNTRKRFWLKVTGVFGLIIGVVLVSAIIGNIYSPIVRTNNIITKIFQWASMAGSLISVPFILNFLSELRILRAESRDIKKQKFLDELLVFTGIIAFIFTVTFGILFASESSSKLYWKNYKRLNYKTSIPQPSIKN